MSAVRAESGPGSTEPVLLPVTVPRGLAKAALGTITDAFSEALALLESGHADQQLVGKADAIARLVVGVASPNQDLLRERIDRQRTIRRVFEEGEWLTTEELNSLQPSPPPNKSHPGTDWKRRGRVFAVNYGGRDYYAAYQFDAGFQPLPVIKEILEAFGEVADTWTLAAWFHFPNAWLVKRDHGKGQSLPPRLCFDQGDAVVAAARKRRGTFVA